MHHRFTRNPTFCGDPSSADEIEKPGVHCMTRAEKAKRTVIGIDISRDELAFRIGCKAMGMVPPRGMTAERAIAEWNITTPPGVPPMGEGFRQAADAAMLFFHECVNAARQPS